MKWRGTFLVVAVLGLAAALTCIGQGEPKPPPVPGETIAFTAAEPASPPYVYLVRADGKDLRRLTKSDAIELSPVWSPDSQRLAYFSYLPPQRPTAEAATPTPQAETVTPTPEPLTPEDLAQRRLILRDLSSAEEKVLADSLPFQANFVSLSWSPDGTAIVYTAITDPSQRPLRASLRVVDVASGRQTAPAGDVQGFLPVWSPDGSKIAFMAYVGEPDESGQQESEPFVMDANGGNIRQLATRLGVDFSLAWSPDGRRIAWWGQDPASRTNHLFLTDVDGGEFKDLGTGSNPVWSPDGRRIAFLEEEAPPPGVFLLRPGVDIFVLDVETGERTNLTPDSGRERWPTWSPDGQQIAFVSERDNRNGEIYVMNADGSDVRRLTDNDLREGMLAWSPRQAIP